MKDQVHIRNAEAAHLARTLAHQTGKTINEVVLDALRQYRPSPGSESSPETLARWRELLRKDWANRNPGPEIPIEDLYDPDTGLPR
jgi:hypothetical protein